MAAVPVFTQQELLTTRPSWVSLSWRITLDHSLKQFFQNIKLKKMKQIFSAFTVLLIAVTFNYAIAQDNSIAFNSPAFKYEFEIAMNNGHLFGIESSNVNAKALKDFSKSFKNVTSEKWYAVEDGFFASFNEKGIETKVAYDQKGNWHCTVRTLDETQMPSDIKDQVKSTYYDSKILVVYEIKSHQATVYIIKTEDSKTLKTLRVADGDIEIIADNTRG